MFTFEFFDKCKKFILSIKIFSGNTRQSNSGHIGGDQIGRDKIVHYDTNPNQEFQERAGAFIDKTKLFDANLVNIEEWMTSYDEYEGASKKITDTMELKSFYNNSITYFSTIAGKHPDNTNYKNKLKRYTELYNAIQD